MYGDFLTENIDEQLVGIVSMLPDCINNKVKEEANVLYCIASDMFDGSVIDIIVDDNKVCLLNTHFCSSFYRNTIYQEYIFI